MIHSNNLIFDALIFNCTLQKDGSYISNNGRIIWSNQDIYKVANTSLVKFEKKKKKKK